MSAEKKSEHKNAVRSKTLIKYAFTQLLAEKELGKITVTDVVEKAGISRGTFYARTLDVDMPTTVDCMVQAQQHKGASVIECLVNCVIFNNGTHDWITNRDSRAERTILLKHGEKMIFGVNKDKGLALDYTQGLIPRLIVVAADDERVLVHNAKEADPTLHRMLAMMGQERYLDTNHDGQGDDLPIALGVIRDVEAESYDQAVNNQIKEVQEKSKVKTFDELLQTLEHWDID